MKAMIIALLCAPFVVNGMHIEKKDIFIPKELSNTKVIYKNKDFHVLNHFTESGHENIVPVERQHISKELRGISKKKLAELLLAGSYLVLKPISEDQYKIELQGRIAGGGAGGAIVGAWGGKFLASFVCHGLIFVVSACTGPAAPVTFAALETTLGATIEAVTTTAAVAGGIAGAVATGPI